MPKLSFTSAIALTIAVLATSSLTGCFEKPKPECAFQCSAENTACPDGYSCRADNWCKLAAVADEFRCTVGPGPEPDGATDTADAPVADAMPADAMPADADPADAFVNSAPTMVLPGSGPDPRTHAIAVNVEETFAITANDVDNGQTVTVSAKLPDGSSALDPFSESEPFAIFSATGTGGTFIWTPQTAGTYEVEFTATDDFSSPASISRTLIIAVTGP